jgi:hypothetical protein
MEHHDRQRRTILRTALVGAAGAALAGTAVLVSTSATQADRPSSVARYDDRVADYGVCRGTDPGCYNAFESEHRTDGRNRVLIYSRTGVSRHSYLGPVLGPGMNPELGETNVGQRALVDWLTDAGLEVDWTEDVAELASPADLMGYDAVIFFSTSRDILDDAAQTSLMQYLRSGGGFVSIHNTLGAEYNWDYFQGLLGGANFYDHGPNRDGTVRTVSRKDASTEDLPRTWDYRDEFYNLVPFPTQVRQLAVLEPGSSEDNTGFYGHPGHPENHPVSWCHYYDGARAWITSLGHDDANFTGAEMPGEESFREHVVGGVLSAAGVEPFCR